YRGLPAGSSLARLLAERRGAVRRRWRPELTVEQILRWADAHLARSGRWPAPTSGSIPGTDENWGAIQQALVHGCRGLPGGTSIPRLLAQARGAPYRKRSHERLTIKQV